MATLDILMSYAFWGGACLSFVGGMCLGFKLADGAER